MIRCLLLCLCVGACSPTKLIVPSDHSLLQKAVQAAGGIEKWQSMEELTFDKTTELYDSTGVLEQQSYQTHRYTYQPNYQIEILTPATNSRLVFADDQLQSWRNNSPQTNANTAKLLANLHAAHFVMELPFRLMLDEVEMRTLPNRVLANFGEMEILEVQYADDSNDVWTFYFDPITHLNTFYEVVHADHISRVVNEEWQQVEGLIFPKERKSYRIDEEGNVLFLRATYVYKNMMVKK